MELVLASVALYLISALLSFFFRKDHRRINFLGAFCSIAASLEGLAGVVYFFFSKGPSTPVSLNFSGFHAFLLDPLSAFFLLTLFIILICVSFYSLDYLKNFGGGKPLWFVWFNYHILAASMTLVLISANAMIFMTAWEAMAVSSFLLVMTDYEKDQVKKAGLIYLSANGAGALFLILAFSLMTDSAPFNFAQVSGGAASLIFLFSLAGFGLKAGFIPLHIWLPEAHPSAPSNVSAIMSGVMIKMGIYGIIRTLYYITPWQDWWGWTILSLGIISGIVGVIFAIAQHEIKKLLAYHSIENIGIILIGVGLSILFRNHGLPDLSALALLGSLLHVLNHAVFKSLLFMGAGSIIHSAHTGDLESFGGLYKKMPKTAVLFIIGAAAISGLPFLNGFISEFLIYYGSFSALKTDFFHAPVFAVISLSIIGALALACFAKASGALFLGEPRTEKTAKASESGPYMLLGMYLLAALCFFIGLFSPLVFKYLLGNILPGFSGSPAYFSAYNALGYITRTYAFLVFAILFVYLLRTALLEGKKTATGPTWDCGYAAPNPGMQYTASSFAQPLTDFFRPLLKIKYHNPGIDGFFPVKADFHSENKAVFYELFYKPLGLRIKKFSAGYSWIQRGKLQFYVLYIVAALIFLILWKI